MRVCVHVACTQVRKHEEGLCKCGSGVGCPCYGVTVRARGTQGVGDGSVSWSFTQVFKKTSGCSCPTQVLAGTEIPGLCLLSVVVFCLFFVVFWCV